MDQLPTQQNKSQSAELLTSPSTTPVRKPVLKGSFKGLLALNGDQAYNAVQPYAYKAKVWFQMIVGFILIVLLLLKALNYFSLFVGWSWFSVLTPIGPLDLVSYALFFSTGIDLAYMLFTPDLDEAIEPVITGLAAAILLFLSQKNLIFNTNNGFGLLLAIITLGALFTLKHYFLKSSKQEIKPPNSEL